MKAEALWTNGKGLELNTWELTRDEKLKDLAESNRVFEW